MGGGSILPRVSHLCVLRVCKPTAIYIQIVALWSLSFPVEDVAEDVDMLVTLRLCSLEMICGIAALFRVVTMVAWKLEKMLLVCTTWLKLDGSPTQQYCNFNIGDPITKMK